MEAGEQDTSKIQRIQLSELYSRLEYIILAGYLNN